MTLLKRNSSIEFLKVVGVALIVLSHVIPFAQGLSYRSLVDISIASNDWNHYILLLLRNCGQIGNMFFLIPSFWFLVSDSQVKINKIINIIADVFIVSATSFLIFFLIGYRNNGIVYIVQQFLPVSTAQYWFITCYLMFYCLHGFVNTALEKIKKTTHFILCFSFVLIYSIARYAFSLFGFEFYWTLFLGFFGIYFIVAYIKRYVFVEKYSYKIPVLFLCFGLVGWIFSATLIYLAGLRIDFLANKQYHLNNISNPFFILIGLGCFGLANKKEFHSRIVNYLSSLSLLMFVVSATKGWMTYAKFDVYNWIMDTFSYDYLIFEVLVVFAIVYLSSTIICIVYKFTIAKITYSISNKLSYFINSIIEKSSTKYDN